MALPHGPVPVNPAGVIINVVVATPPLASVTVTVASAPAVLVGVPLIKPPPIPVDMDIPVGNPPVKAKLYCCTPPVGVTWQLAAMFCLTWVIQAGACTLRGLDSVLEPPSGACPKQSAGSPRSNSNFSG